MAKSSGLGARFLVDGFNISGDVGSIGSIAGSGEELDMTGIDKEGKERILGLRDGSMEWSAFWNPGPANNAAHKVLGTLPSADRVVTYAHRAQLGAAAASLVSKQLNYDGERGGTGEFALSVQAVANGFGRDWGVLATPGIRADAAATNGTGLDLGTGPLAFGAQAYLHLLALTGTTITARLQHSNDNGAGDPWADLAGGGFPAMTAIGAARVATARTLPVKRWIRVATTGTFTAAQLLVNVVRNDELVAA